MNARLTSLALTTLALAASMPTAAFAQSTYGLQPSTQIQTEYGYDGGYGVGWGYGPATAAESMYRGYADLVRSYGINNLYNAEAQVQWENAYAKRIVNHQQAVETYFHLKKVNHEARFGDVAARRVVNKARVAAMSKQSAPARLDDNHWDVLADGFIWPEALADTEYDAAKTELDDLFRERRTSASGFTKTELARANAAVQTLAGGLKTNVAQLSGTEYAAAKRFLTTLTYEAKLLPENSQVASN